MNLREISGPFRALMFRLSRTAASFLPGGRMAAFGAGGNRIGSILVVNLDRQPGRWRRVQRELARFRTHDGACLLSLARRLTAVDARDGRAVAATADVDATYRMGDQLFVQPNARLQECFGLDEPIRMTRQEVAVARSHVEAWKAVASGEDNHVLVLEDDVWFERGAAKAIDRGWLEALQRSSAAGAPHLLYLSFRDAGGTAERTDVSDILFCPVRGLWFLSGYVLSREGAAALLRAMPVVGPVDLWINFRFAELGALALCRSVIQQREDGSSDNSYSVLPYLARAGIVDAGSGLMRPAAATVGPVFAWTAPSERDGLAMALSMLGLRVRVFKGDEELIEAEDLENITAVFDAVVDAPMTPTALSAAIEQPTSRFVLEAGAALALSLSDGPFPPARTVLLTNAAEDQSWKPLCDLLRLAEPVEGFPAGTLRSWRTFNVGLSEVTAACTVQPLTTLPGLDDSPWVLPPRCGWKPRFLNGVSTQPLGDRLVSANMSTASASFPMMVETFPGNLASFATDGLEYGPGGARLVLSPAIDGPRPYRSGAFVSASSFGHGRFEAEIKAAGGSGLVTGFFLHRDLPRQEIDIELTGADPCCMLVNVYFNPGDDGAAMGFGYRGSPCRVELGFDATLGYHVYAIDWRPGCISWLVDGKVVHKRVGWDPTPVPHLPMRLHANLWAPRSEELAGRLDEVALPAAAWFRNISISGRA